MNRLFFAMEIIAPWPEELPEGRKIREEDRHITLAFLGEVEVAKVPIASFPTYPLKTGIAAVFDNVLFLPKHTPRVVAYHLHFLEEKEPFFLYQKEIAEWLNLKSQSFLPHVTVARTPFAEDDWKNGFQPLPCYTGNLRLYESLGSSQYNALWEMPILPPFESIPHTADLAFLIRGDSWAQFDLHAWLALSFHEPSLIEEFVPMEANSFEEVVRNLNRRIALVDAKRGSPFKAVSYHGRIKNGEWEMIVDV